MICPNCGTSNSDNSSFCMKCGTNMKEVNDTMSVGGSTVQYTQPIENAQPQNNIQNGYTNPVFNQQPVYNQPNVQVQQSFVNQQTVSKPNVTTASLNYLMYIIAIILKPFKSFKEEVEKLNNAKTSFIFTLIIAFAMTIVNLIKTILNTVHVSTYTYSEGFKKTWVWENIKNIKWLEVIGKNFLIYIGIMLAIAVVYYIAGLIIKKELGFIKALSISATSIVPAVIGAMILAPLAQIVWFPLSILFMVTGVTYSFTILYELINDELKLNGDTKIYFNLICIGILAFAGYFLYTRLLLGSVATAAKDGLSGLLDMFK